MELVTTEYREFDRKFLAVEEELDLFSFEANGIRIWERVRHEVALTLLAELDILGAVGRTERPSLVEYTRYSYLGIRNLVRRNPLLRSQRDVLSFGRGRRKQFDGEWWDLYFDPLYESLDADFLHLESSRCGEHYTPERTDQIAYLDFVYYFRQFCYLSGVVGYTFSADERRMIETIENRLEAEFGVTLDVASIVQQELVQRKAGKPLYELILDRVDPSIVLLTVNGSRKTLIECCQEAGIPVVEIQHGQISRFSYNYSYPGERRPTVFPDYLLTLGDAWGEIVPLPLDSDRVVSVGYPHLERQLEAHDHAADKQRLLFLSTSETGVALSKLAARASRRDDITADIVYKLHPAEAVSWDSDYPWLVDAPVEIIDETGLSVYELFARSTAQIGVCSTAVYEGLAFGLDTYLFEYPSVEWNADLLESGVADFVTDASDLADAMSDRRSHSFDREYYFEPNAVENAVTAIENLLDSATQRPEVRDE